MALIAKPVSTDNTTGIRSINPMRDLGQLADLIENAFGAELSEGGERVLREIRLLSKLGPLNYLFVGMSEAEGMFNGFVWEQHGRIVGNVSVSRPSGHSHKWQISNVAVLDTHRGQGIGRSLVEAAIDLIARRGGRSAYLFVRDDNPSALGLYRSMRFVEVDRTTDLKFPPPPVSSRSRSLSLLEPLEPAREHALYELVRRAEGPGHYWLYTVRRRQYVLSADERLFRRVESLFTGETELRWCVPDVHMLRAAVVLRATRLWNWRPHRLQLWIHPNWRDHLADALAGDIAAILSARPRRPSYVSLPACEAQATAALLETGFSLVRTLILMKLDL
jgi:ribosomal protein S18 acetylase RimI-like enzyme